MLLDQVFGGEAASCRYVDHVHHHARVEPELASDRDRLADGGKARAGQEIIEAFHRMTAAQRADLEKLAAHTGEKRLHRSDLDWIAADHDRERAIFGPRNAAGHRCIHEMQLSRSKLLAERAGADRVGRTHIDHDGSWLQTGSKCA